MIPDLTYLGDGASLKSEWFCRPRNWLPHAEGSTEGPWGQDPRGPPVVESKEVDSADSLSELWSSSVVGRARSWASVGRRRRTLPAPLTTDALG